VNFVEQFGKPLDLIDRHELRGRGKLLGEPPRILAEREEYGAVEQIVNDRLGELVPDQRGLASLAGSQEEMRLPPEESGQIESSRYLWMVLCRRHNRHLS
jgi:hypothetical protein